MSCYYTPVVLPCADPGQEEPRAGAGGPGMDRGSPGPEVARPAGGHHQGRPSAVSNDEQACPRRCPQDQLLRRSVQDDGEHQQVRCFVF